MTEAAPSTVPPAKRGSFRRKPRRDGEKQQPKKCCYCEIPKQVHFWKSPIQPVCIACYQKFINVEACSICGESKTVRMRDENGGAICHKCYQQIRPRETCWTCKQPGKIVKWLDGKKHKKGQCNLCYQRARRKRLKRESKPS